MPSPILVPNVYTEPVASVMRVLQLEGTADQDDTFRGCSIPQIRRIYGGQVVAQGMLAAAATVPDPERMPHSLHAYFLRGGRPGNPLTLKVDRLRDGRSFSSRGVNVFQQQRVLMTMNVSFQGAEGGAESQYAMPDVPGPEALDSALELFRTLDHPVAKFLGKTSAFDVRHVQRSLYVAPGPGEEPMVPQTTQEVWMRPRTGIPAGTAQVVHRALLAYAVDQIMLEPSLRSVGLTWVTSGMSLASLDHAMWFHQDVDINQWLLFAGRSSSVRGGRAKAELSVYQRSGELVATAAQEGMMRLPLDNAKASSRWTFEA